MERWSGRVAIVTGAGSGIGAATTTSLVNYGLTVIGIDKVVEKVESLITEIKEATGTLHPKKCDVSKEEEIMEVFHWVKEHFGGIDILVNCAGIYFKTQLSDINTEQFRLSFKVNVIGLSICTREAIKSMKEKGVDGHIIHLSSVAGHIPVFSSEIALYSSTKYAVKALAEGLRRELVEQRSKIKITNISPGIVDTELFRNSGLAELSPTGVVPVLQPEDVANAVLFTLGTPPHVQVHEIIIRPIGEPF